jgi:hypothetical protein
MKKYLYQILTIAILLFATQSCFQDLDNDPPFNFPQEPEKPEPPVDPTGLIFYMSFDGNFIDEKSEIAATVVGTPTFAEGKEGQAYAGAADSYLTFKVDDLVQEPESDFSVAFWYKVNANPDRAGIFTITPGVPETRSKGLRIFRETTPAGQILKAALGTGTGDAWLDGGAASTIDPELTDWVHVAVTMTNGTAIFYFDGEPVSTNSSFAGISWDECNVISIGSGAPGFTEWGHLSDQSLIDELRLYNKTLSPDDIKKLMNVKPPLGISGEIFYAPFNNSFRDISSGVNPTVVGTPSFAAGISGRAYAGATDSYLSYAVSDLSETLGEELTVSFWYKVNADPNRAGIITIGNNVFEDRSNGFRIFREATGANQIIKANVGIGGGEVWVDGGPAAQINAETPEWLHIALVLDAESATLYINGEVVRESSMSAPIDWTDCEAFSVGSGVPTFTEWDFNRSDLSLIDELRMFNRALSAAEIEEIIAYDN